MTKTAAPEPDKLIGPIKYRPPKGKPQDRPLELLHREFDLHQRSRRKDKRAASFKR
jgi:hypothetical protein